MASPMTDGYLYRNGTTPQTKSVISARFKIFSSAVGVGRAIRMGVCSAFNISESRQIDAVRGLGYGDTIAELVPGVTQPMELSITRTALYLANIMQVLGYKSGVSGAVRSLKHHRWPFDIRTEIVLPDLVNDDSSASGLPMANIASEGGFNNLGNPGLRALVTIYEGCWMNNYSTAFQVEQAAVTEDVGVTVHDVYDLSSVYGEFLDAGMSPGDVTGSSLMFAKA